MTFTATATDQDNPAQTLTFSLDAASLAAGMTIDGATGAFSWMPTEFQGGTTYAVTVTVTDDGTNPDELTDAESITITVIEANTAPVLNDVLGSGTIAEGMPHTFTATAFDYDIPVQALTFSLSASAPSGASIDGSTGVFTWTAEENQGPGVYTFDVIVSDGELTDAESITITVIEENAAPVLLNVPSSADIDEEVAFSFDADATDNDIPVQTLIFSLVGAPEGALIDGSTGVFTWTPNESQGPDSYTFTVRVSDGVANTDQSVTLNVAEINTAPVLNDVLGSGTIAEGMPHTFTATAFDYDIPVQALTFSLSASAPSGASIDGSTGVFTWTAEENQGPGVYTFDVIVSDGELTDAESITITVIEENAAPVLLNVPSSADIDEEVAYSFDADATDNDIPVQTLIFSLVGAPEGALIDGSTGVFTWTPDESQGPDSYTFTVRVSDGVANTDQSVTLNVAEINVAPVLLNIPSSADIDEEVAYSFDADATDHDIPHTLIFSLGGAPEGALIDGSTGVFTWTPNESQGPDSYTFTIRVSDGVANTDQSVTLNVAEINTAPVLNDVLGSGTIAEGMPHTFTATAFDYDIPVQALTFSLSASAPSGASIDGSTGVFTWTAEENQGPGVYTFDVIVSDGELTDAESITITVIEENAAPVLLNVPSSADIDEEVAYSFDADATDNDIPVQTLIFSLVGAPEGALIDGSTGVFTWTPDESQGPDSYTFTVRVSDGVANTDQSVTLNVAEINVAPELDPIGNKSVNEQALLSFTATATDQDVPAQTLAFTLDATSIAAGMSITSGGAFSWTPAVAQGGFTYPVTITVTDNGSPILSDFETFNITVAEVNVAPILAVIGNKSVNEQALLSFTATATDQDVPAQALTFTLDAASITAGMSITPGGVFSWTPTETRGGATYPVTITVTDNGTPILSDFETFNITVAEVNVAPVLAVIGNKSVNEQALLSFTATAIDQDVPAQTLAFTLDAASIAAGMSITSGGVFSWTPTETRGGATYPVTITVIDNGTPIMSDFETFNITVAEVNVAPVLATIGNKSVNAQTTLSFTATATDQDVPAQTLAFTLDAASIAAGMSITSGGVFSWTPTVAQSGITYPVTVTVRDNGTNPASLSDYETFNITVTGQTGSASVTVSPSTVQYSDQVTFTARITGGAQLLGSRPWAGIAATFRVGTQFMGTVILRISGNDLEGNLTREMLETVNGQMAPGDKTVTAVFNGFNITGNISPNPATTNLTITREDARVNYTGSYIASSSGNTGPQVLLRATVQDITAVTGDPAYDQYGGDIRKARVRFLKGTNPISGWLTPQLVNGRDLKTGVVSYNWTADNGSRNDVINDINIEVGGSGYYVRNNPSDMSLLTLYVPSGNYVTGGGYLTNPNNTGGTYAGDRGLRTNFGIIAKFNNGGANLRGNIDFIISRTVGGVLHTYQVRSTSMTSVAVNVRYRGTNTAVLEARANLTDITDPALPVLEKSNLRLQARISDRGQTGNNDLLALSLWEGNTLLFSSRWTGTSTTEQQISGGNLIINSGSSFGNIYAGSVNDQQEFILGAEFGVTAYPNPFVDHVNFDLQLKTDSKVRLEIYTIAGSKLATLFDDVVVAYDKYRVEYTPENFSTGTLIYRLTVDGQLMFTGKLIKY